MKARVQHIVDRIITEAEQHSELRYDEITGSIRDRIESENQAQSDNLHKRRDLLLRHNEREYLRLLEQLESRFSRDRLAYEHSLVDEIFEDALVKLRESTNEEFYTMFSEAVRDLTGTYTLLPGRLSAGKINAADVERATSGNPELHITLGDTTIAAKSGFLLQNQFVEYNCLFEDLIEQLKSENSALIHMELFKDFT